MAIVWGSFVIPIFSKQAILKNYASHIIAGEPYKANVLFQKTQSLEAAENLNLCRPIARRSAAIIRLRLFEEAGHKSIGKPADTQNTEALESTIRSSLECSPAEPFLWLALYWLKNEHNLGAPQHQNYLRMSYELGPNEGWIAVKRNHIALANYNRLSPELANDAVNEFTTLLKNEIYAPAIEVFSGLDSSVRAAILPHLEPLPLRIRAAFAKAIYDKGLDVEIPGVELPESKPRWQ